MALIVQNDEGTEADANSYDTVVNFQAYWTARNVDYTGTATEILEAALIAAWTYLDSRFVWAGYKTNGRDQTTAFPRDELYDCSGEEFVLVTGIPREAKEAQFEYAHIFIVQGTLQENGLLKGNVKRFKRKVGPIEREYEYSPPGEAGAVVAYPQADNKIPKCFIIESGNMAVHV